MNCLTVSVPFSSINPDPQRFLAKRMSANTIEVDAAHLSLVSHPQQIADLILKTAEVKN